ncbi:MAG: hypothetical protein LBU03_00100 [Tannerellaceae bacterium]|jgi:hypothetical protein|nr:hypothetical protein [Tannerellaceae bacterium]
MTKVWVVVWAVVMSASARYTKVEMSIAPSAILIGEQAVVTVTVTSEADSRVQVILPTDTLMLGIEIVETSGWDTSAVENGRVTMRQELRVTSFDSSLYLLPPIVAVDLNDTVFSNQEALKVSTVPDVDIAHPENFYDIKTLWEPPFVWKDYLGYLLWFLLALTLGGVTWYGIKYWRRRKSLLPEKDEPKIPAHERALKALEEIKQQKLWQQGKNKEYYTGVTDTLRHYISERFDMDAMEMTSGEILDGIHGVHDADSVYRNLEQVLTLADFVKFAKKIPLSDENDLSMKNAFLFVEETKVTLPLAEEAKTTDGAVEEKVDRVQKEE